MKPWLGSIRAVNSSTAGCWSRSGRGVVTALSPKRLDITVPSDTTQIEMLFHNFVEIGGRCDAWDSRFGENYGSMSPDHPVDLAIRFDTGRERSQSRFVNLVDQTAQEERVPAPRSGPLWAKIADLFLTCAQWVRNVA